MDPHTTAVFMCIYVYIRRYDKTIQRCVVVKCCEAFRFSPPRSQTACTTARLLRCRRVRCGRPASRRGRRCCRHHRCFVVVVVVDDCPPDNLLFNAEHTFATLECAALTRTAIALKRRVLIKPYVCTASETLSAVPPYAAMTMMLHASVC